MEKVSVKHCVAVLTGLAPNAISPLPMMTLVVVTVVGPAMTKELKSNRSLKMKKMNERNLGSKKWNPILVTSFKCGPESLSSGLRLINQFFFVIKTVRNILKKRDL